MTLEIFRKGNEADRKVIRFDLSRSSLAIPASSEAEQVQTFGSVSRIISQASIDPNVLGLEMGFSNGYTRFKDGYMLGFTIRIYLGEDASLEEASVSKIKPELKLFEFLLKQNGIALDYSLDYVNQTDLEDDFSEDPYDVSKWGEFSGYDLDASVLRIKFTD